MNPSANFQSEQLQAELCFYKSALDAHAIVAMTNPKGQITYVNDKFCEISGYAPDELLGADHRILNSGYHPKSFFREMYATIACGQIWQGEIRNRAKNGSFYWVFTTIVPMLDAQDRVTSYVAIRQDITARKRADEALVAAKEAAEAANRAKDEFLANVSHEIRTPLLAITGYAELLGDAEVMEQDRRSYADSVCRQSEHLLMLINDLLDASKIESGRMTLEAIPVSVAFVLDEVEAMMRPLAERKGIDIRVSRDSDIPPRIQTDPLRLRQVLINLVANAIKFTTAGSVHVHARSQSTPGGAIDMVFEVRDTGIGIAPDALSRLFKRFSQADSSTTRNFGGTGIGLYLSSGLAAMMNGQITVDSTPGVGSTFCLVMRDIVQLDEVAHVRSSDSQSPASAAKPLDGLHIVLAEDGPDSQVLLRLWLTKAGATVTVVENGRKACDVALRSPQIEECCDLLLMDLQMPVMDGLEATRTIRAGGRTVPILALTASATPADRTKALEAGCDEYIAKPVSKERLIAACARHARQSRRAA